jgi:hypothetical protein
MLKNMFRDIKIRRGTEIFILVEFELGFIDAMSDFCSEVPHWTECFSQAH